MKPGSVQNKKLWGPGGGEKGPGRDVESMSQGIVEQKLPDVALASVGESTGKKRGGKGELGRMGESRPELSWRDGKSMTIKNNARSCWGGDFS